MTAGLVIVGLLGWTVLAAMLAPFVGAAIAGRRMTATERDQLAWGGLGVFMALFIIAALLIGARP